MNAIHDGFSSTTLTPPLTKAWSVDFGSTVSYPLIADGRVFVAVANQGAYGMKLHAYDRDAGTKIWGPIDLGGTYNWAGLAYDDGSVFVVTFDGLLSAFDGATGTHLWSRDLPGQYAFSSAPTAAYGVVFLGGAGSGGTVYAVDELSGAVLWTAPVQNGDDSSPVVTRSGVFVSYACNQDYRFVPETGALMWHHTSSCSGGGGATPVLHGPSLYSRDWATANVILDAATGADLGGFSATATPAFDGSRGFFLVGATLEGRDAATNSVIWSMSDGALSTAPVVANGIVYVGSTKGIVYGLDEATGATVWSDTIGKTITGWDNRVGLAIGEGYLIVPADTTLTAYHAAD